MTAIQVLVSVPGSEEITFATKPQIALEQIRAAKAAGVPVGVVPGDAGHGNGIEFRDGVRGNSD